MTNPLAGVHRPVNFDNGVTVFVATCDVCDVPWPCSFAQERECWCGATISQVDLPDDLAALDGHGTVWVSNHGQTHCYPDADNAADRSARHEPMDA